MKRYLGIGDFLQESQMTHLFKEGLLAVFSLLPVASLAKDGGIAEDICSGPCRQRIPSGRIAGLSS